MRLKLIPALAIALLLLAWGPPSYATGRTVWAVGDGADTGSSDDALAAMIAQHNSDAFLYLGDVYEHGTAGEFSLGYDPGYGRLKSITYPTPGNHEWDNRGEGYDRYWSPRFTSPHYYSFDLGTWHLISLNSEEAYDQGSPQLSWLRADLSERRGNCTIAFWHRPRYSAGTNHGDERGLATFWGMLAGRATIVLTGHDHNYQRLKPIDGITSWVVGTGGHGHVDVDANDPRLDAYNATTYGALRLELTSSRADYAFFSAAGPILDSGAVGCDRTKSPRSKPDSRPPRLTRVTTSWKRFRQGVRASRRLAIRYTLSERAKVTITIQRVSKRRVTSLRELTDAGQRGLNRKLFSGTVARRALRPASYRAVLEATDAADNISKPKTVSFRVLRARTRLP
jgi:calcineurin-like phosphoesterase family protein